MGNRKSKAPDQKVEINNLNDLVRLNLNTLEDVVNGDGDLKRAQLIFTGSRTITGAMKVGIEAMKLGFKQIGGIDVGDVKKLEGAAEGRGQG